MNNFLLTIAKPWFCKWINAKAGGMIQNAVGAAIGWGVKLLAEKLGVEVPPSLVQEVNLAAVTCGMFVVTTAVQWWQTGRVQKVQAALGLPESHQDGDLGPVTIRRAEAVTEDAPAFKLPHTRM